MADMLEMAATFFANRHWPCAMIAKPRAVEVVHDFSVERFRSYAQAENGGRIFVYDSVCPAQAPAERRDAVMRYLTLVNFGQLVGAFEMDLADGEVRFRTSIDLEGQPLTDALLSGVVYPNHQAVTDYLPGLLAVIRGEQEPDAAFAEAREP